MLWLATKKAKWASKDCSAFWRAFGWFAWQAHFSGKASRGKSAIGSVFAWKGHCFREERGFLLVFLSPLLLLGLVFFLGTLRISLDAQGKTAIEARLDICAVRLIEGRKAALGNLQRANALLRINVKAIYAARAAKVAGPVGAMAGAAAEAALLASNRALALLEVGMIARAQAKELEDLRCPPTQFSKDRAFCVVRPAISAATEKEKTFYADVSGARIHRQQERTLLKVLCQAQGKSRTRLELNGDPSVTRNDFHDAYTE